MKIKQIDFGEWSFYVNVDKLNLLLSEHCGKWMYFFNSGKKDMQFIKSISKLAIEDDVCIQVKHTREFITYFQPSGVCCFYCNGNNLNEHRKIIEFFIENDMIRKKDNGNLYDIAFKYERQSDNGEYVPNFQSIISLSNFIDIETEKWKS